NLFTLSAKTDNALKQYVKDHIEFFESENEKLEDICYSSNNRAAHNHRLAVVCENISDLKNHLNNYKDGKNSFDIISAATKLNHQPKIAFLFPGQGAQYIGMGKELYDTNSLFRKTINRCDEILRDYLDKSLLEVLFFEKDENVNPIDETTYTQPALFAVEYSLAMVWMSWGIKPSLMMGHSAGEYVAACLAGAFSLEDGLKLVTERGRLMETLTSNGEMYTIFADEQTVKSAITGFESSVSLASINSPVKTVISGDKDSISKILPSFDASQTEYKKINVSIASHSPLMNSMIEEFRKVCSSIQYSTPSTPVVSNITGEIVTDKISNADYWCDHILSSVRFSDGIKACVNYGIDTFIDLGPKPTSIGMAQETVMDSGLTWLASIKKNFTIWETMLQGLGTLYVNGTEIDWKNLDKEYSHKIISLPSYPFQKQRYWIDENKSNSTKAFLSSSNEKNINSLVGTRIVSASVNEFIFNSYISSNSPSYLNDHRVFGKVVIPGAAYAEIALSAGASVFKDQKIKLSNIRFHLPIVINSDEVKILQTVISREKKNNFRFEIFTMNEG
ncbi:MAG: acyltransferase domain-containing protein, partial [Ignavibacteria bacterium]